MERLLCALMTLAIIIFMAEDLSGFSNLSNLLAQPDVYQREAAFNGQPGGCDDNVGRLLHHMPRAQIEKCAVVRLHKKDLQQPLELSPGVFRPEEGNTIQSVDHHTFVVYEGFVLDPALDIDPKTHAPRILPVQLYLSRILGLFDDSPSLTDERATSSLMLSVEEGSRYHELFVNSQHRTTLGEGLTVNQFLQKYSSHQVPAVSSVN